MKKLLTKASITLIALGCAFTYASAMFETELPAGITVAIKAPNGKYLAVQANKAITATGNSFRDENCQFKVLRFNRFIGFMQQGINMQAVHQIEDPGFAVGALRVKNTNFSADWATWEQFTLEGSSLWAIKLFNNANQGYVLVEADGSVTAMHGNKNGSNFSIEVVDLQALQAQRDAEIAAQKAAAEAAAQLAQQQAELKALQDQMAADKQKELDAQKALADQQAATQAIFDQIAAEKQKTLDMQKALADQQAAQKLADQQAAVMAQEKVIEAQLFGIDNLSTTVGASTQSLATRATTINDALTSLSTKLETVFSKLQTPAS